jgi:uncharacterized protein
MNPKYSVLGATALLLLSGCNSKTASPEVELANPAATYCANQGGTYDLDTGNCRLPDGTEIDGWEYYRAQE